MSETTYNVIAPESGVPVKAWTKGVPLEDAARKQLLNAAQLPFIFKWIAAMPDVHWGIGATVGSVIPTKGAIIPAAVGVDIGCGMMAVQTSLNARDLPDSLKGIRTAIEIAVPHGRTNHGGAGDRGAWHDIPERNGSVWLGELKARYDAILAKHPKLDRGNHANHLGTLGTGNHFIEVCLDESETVWFMLHSGSRGVGNRMGSYFIDVARKDMKKFFVNLPDVDLAYFPEHTEHFDDYVEAVEWAQDYARRNRDLMMEQIVGAVRNSGELPPFNAELKAINCHHNYVARESHFGENVLITRKGAVRAREGDMGIIPGSMGARSFIVRGKGNPESFSSCSHGAGRAMSRNEAKRRFTVEDHMRMTEGVECRKDEDVIDETPAAYKPIDAVMAAQANLPRHIAQREVETVGKMLNWGPESFSVEESRNSAGPGNIVMIEIGSADVTEIFSAFGQVGLSAEKVASIAARDARGYLVSRAAAGEHLTDQLLLPIALAGAGSFTAEKINMHARTNMTVISQFLPVRFETRLEDGFTRVNLAE